MQIRLYSFSSASFVAERPPCLVGMVENSCGSDIQSGRFQNLMFEGKEKRPKPKFHVMFHTDRMLDKMKQDEIRGCGIAKVNRLLLREQKRYTESIR